MKPFRALLIPVLLQALSAAAAGDLRVAQAWTRATPVAGVTAGGYLVIDNRGGEDRLLSADSPRAAHIELHEMKMDGAVMRMRALTDGIPVPAHRTLDFNAAGYHLMLIAPPQAFAAGERVPVHLHFRKAGEVQVELQVRAATATE